MKTEKNVVVMVLDPMADLFRGTGRLQKQMQRLETLVRDNRAVRLLGLVHSSHFGIAKRSSLGQLFRSDVREAKLGPAKMVEQGYQHILDRQDTWKTDHVIRVNPDHSMNCLMRMHVRLANGHEAVLGRPHYDLETIDGNCQHIDRMLISTVDLQHAGWELRETHHVQGYSLQALKRILPEAQRQFVKACMMRASEEIPYGFDLAMVIAAALKGAAQSFGSVAFEQRQSRMDDRERGQRIQSYAAVLAAAGIVDVGVPVPA